MEWFCPKCGSNVAPRATGVREVVRCVRCGAEGTEDAFVPVLGSLVLRHGAKSDTNLTYCGIAPPNLELWAERWEDVTCLECLKQAGRGVFQLAPTPEHPDPRRLSELELVSLEHWLSGADAQFQERVLAAASHGFQEAELLTTLASLKENPWDTIILHYDAGEWSVELQLDGVGKKKLEPGTDLLQLLKGAKRIKGHFFRHGRCCGELEEYHL